MPPAVEPHEEATSLKGLRLPLKDGRVLRLQATLETPAPAPLLSEELLEPLRGHPCPPPTACWTEPGLPLLASPASSPPASLPSPLLLAPRSKIRVARAAKAPSLQHPSVGGPLTALVLCYGDYPALHHRCLEALLPAVEAQQLTLRVAGNALGAASRDWLEQLQEEGWLVEFQDHRENRKKYPAQRQLWAAPLPSKWLLWLDDDSFCDIRPDWLELLGQQIIAGSTAEKSAPERLGCVGPKKIFTLTPQQAAWVRQASWFRGRPFQDSHGKGQPGANKVHFAVGAFWALKTECITRCHLPDPRLGHNGGDWAMGAALWQNGYSVRNFSLHKEIVRWSAHPRRGLSEAHPRAG